MITPDGRYVVFTSVASNMVANDTEDTNDIFVRDLKAKTTKLVTINNAKLPSEGRESNYAITADGRFVIFTSTGNNIVANDTNQKADVFIRDFKTNTTKLISINHTQNDSGNGESNMISVGSSGRFVRFSSYADLITYQFLKETENLGNEKLFCKHLFKYRSPRVNQDTTLRASFLKVQCLRSLCSFVFFPKESDDVKHYLDQYEHTNALLVT